MTETAPIGPVGGIAPVAPSRDIARIAPSRDIARIAPAREIARIAAVAERDLARLAAAWAGLDGMSRAAAARGMARTAPGVLRLLCPEYGRFGAN